MRFVTIEQICSRSIRPRPANRDWRMASFGGMLCAIHFAESVLSAFSVPAPPAARLAWQAAGGPPSRHTSRNWNGVGGPGASNGSFQGQTYAILQALASGPSVVSINRTQAGDAAAYARSVSFTVTFSAAVTGVDSTDFTPVKTGAVGAALLQVTPVS